MSFLKTWVVFSLLLVCPLFISADTRKDLWVPMKERVRIWDEVVARELSLPLPLHDPKPYIISKNGLEAIFEKNGTKWTIIGANAPIVNPTIYPKTWPVKGEDFEVMIIPEPITNYKILPYSEIIENAKKSDTISVIAARGNYEPASFVIRSGDEELKDVMVNVTDLTSDRTDNGIKERTVAISKDNIDIRVVKCWYQAGNQLYDTKHKQLKPELLLHDDKLIRADYYAQVDILRDFQSLRDTEKLLPFDIPRRQNKQLWLTVKVNTAVKPGKYRGHLSIYTRNNKIKSLEIVLEVLPFILPEPVIEYCLYYNGYLSMNNRPIVDHLSKTELQMEYEFADMREHGLTNATLKHVFAPDEKKWTSSLDLLKRTIEIRNRIGWSKKPLLYLDWIPMFRENLILYKKKVESIVALSHSFGIKEVYIYGLDEVSGKALLRARSLYQTVHDAGAKVFVACYEDFLHYIPDLIDIPIIWAQPKHEFIKKIREKQIKIWSYGNPQAGNEDPETYRINYGLKLLIDGFSGACDYEYQEEWNDFIDLRNRSHTMAYPTIEKPIPTIQWEGWREGVNDVRYATLLNNLDLLSDTLLQNCSTDVTHCRDKYLLPKLKQTIVPSKQN